MRRITCIICPRGCGLQIDRQGDEYIVTGHMCKRGNEFALNEMTNPTRSLTTTIRTIYSDFPRLPVKTDGELPLGRIFDAMKIINSAVVDHAVQSGEIVVENILNTGINIVATVDMLLLCEKQQ